MHNYAEFQMIFIMFPNKNVFCSNTFMHALRSVSYIGYGNNSLQNIFNRCDLIYETCLPICQTKSGKLFVFINCYVLSFLLNCTNGANLEFRCHFMPKLCALLLKLNYYIAIYNLICELPSGTAGYII